MYMKRTLIITVLILTFIIGCATHDAYDTAEFRQREYNVGSITLEQGGLTPDQIQVISTTKPPQEFPVDIAIIVLADAYVPENTELLFVSEVIEQLKLSDKINRIVPIPKFLIPQNLTFATIQELGISTLSEYVIIFILDSDTFFKWTRILERQYEISSVIDFLMTYIHRNQHSLNNKNIKYNKLYKLDKLCTLFIR